MKKSRILFLLFLFIMQGFAQAPSIEWQKTFGGTNQDYTTYTKQTSDGGFIVAGYTSSLNGDVTVNHGGYDYFITKLSNLGTLEWQKTYGGSGDDYAYSIQQTTDGGYIAAGYTKSSNGDVTNFHGGDGDFWVIKLYNDGNIQWQKTYGGTREDNAYSIQQTIDGGYLVAGHSWSNDGDVTNNNGYSDGWIVKLDNLGAIQWQKVIGGAGTDESIHCVKQTSDGGYILAGNVVPEPFNFSNSNLLIIKVDGLGNVLWQKTLGGSGADDGVNIQQTSDNGYIIAGYTASIDGNVTGNHGGYDCWIIKTDDIGNIIWQKTYGGTNTDVSFDVKQVVGGYVILGFSDSINGDLVGNHGNSDCWILRINDIGDIQWQKTLGGTGLDSGRSFEVTLDGGYIVAGYSESTNGDLMSNHGGGDFWIVKLMSDNLKVNNYNSKAFSIFPNPTKDILNIHFDNINKINIVDMTGKNILSKEKSNSINVSSLQKGMYFVQIEEDGILYSEKFIKE